MACGPTNRPGRQRQRGFLPAYAAQQVDPALALRRRGLAMPGDVSVISMGDSDLAELLEPGISALQWDGKEEGRIAATMLMERIAGDDTPPRRVMLPTRLLTRASERQVPGSV